MTASTSASLEHLLAAEQLAKRRQYVLANTRARWGIVGFAIVLLAAMRLTRVVVFPWGFLVGFAAAAASLNYVMYRLGPGGHLLYAAYLIAPLQAAVYLGRREVWQALAINVGAFAVATTLRTLEGLWTWSAFVQETLVLVFVVAALAPLLAKIIERLQVARGTLAQIEGGDLTARVDDPEHDELGYLGLSLGRTTDAIAEIVRSEE